MTAPDHRPYAVPGDLITAGDVICELIRMSDEEGAYTRKEGLAIRRACYALLARLDRERRQACRRGYKAEIQQARYHKSMEREARARLKVRHSDNDAVCAEGDLWMRRAHVERALAFRAAARAR